MNWLLLRGLGREQRHWGEFSANLQRLTGAGVMCLDLPGSGTQHQQASATSVEASVTNLRQRWLAQRGNEDNWGILGLSLGGMLTLHWLHQYPQDFSLGVLINSSAAALSKPWQRLRPQAALTLMAACLTPDILQRERRILALSSNHCQGNDAIARIWAAYAKDAPLSRGNFLRQISAALRFTAPRQIDPPLLLLCSAKDRLVHPVCSEAMATHYGTQLRCHPSAGHDLPLDDPDWVVNQLQQFSSLHLCAAANP